MIAIFQENPLLLLFFVAALGYGIGNIKIKGSGLGVAAVLFVGLAIGALDKSLQIPNIVFLLGLSIFCYTIGLSSGPSFFQNFKKSGFRDIVFIIVMLSFSGTLTALLHYLFAFEATTSAGLFAGSSTNTPALAGLLDTINKQGEGTAIDALIEQSVVGYSLSYPMGILGVMLAIGIMKKMLKIDFKKEAKELGKTYPINQSIVSQTIEITNKAIVNMSIRDLMNQEQWKVVFGRFEHAATVKLTTWDTLLNCHDKIIVIGDEAEVKKVTNYLGVKDANHLGYDRTAYDVRRIFVSNPQLAGKTIASLNLDQQFSAIITRVRRGDIDVLANNDTILELGDRIRFVARRKDLDTLSKLFGDSYDAVSHVNLLSFGMGMTLGLLLGMVNFQLPGGINFNLGFAGGPLIVGLLLGALRRTGPMVWTMPYSANLILRQFGLILLLSFIGIRSGHTFVNTIISGGAGLIFIAGAIISTVTAFVTLFIGYKFVKIPFSFLIGMVASQPATLQFAIDQSENNLPNFGYVLIFPIALITKIVYVQLLFAFLS